MENQKLESDREKIASRLKEARILAGLSQAQSAEKLGIQRPTISEIEAGRRKVGAEELIRFADLYKVDSSWLLLNEKDENKYNSENFKYAARELEKLSLEDIKKLVDILKILPK